MDQFENMVLGKHGQMLVVNEPIKNQKIMQNMVFIIHLHNENQRRVVIYPGYKLNSGLQVPILISTEKHHDIDNENIKILFNCQSVIRITQPAVHNIAHTTDVVLYIFIFISQPIS